MRPPALTPLRAPMASLTLPWLSRRSTACGAWWAAGARHAPRRVSNACAPCTVWLGVRVLRVVSGHMSRGVLQQDDWASEHCSEDIHFCPQKSYEKQKKQTFGSGSRPDSESVTCVGSYSCTLLVSNRVPTPLALARAERRAWGCGGVGVGGKWVWGVSGWG